MALKPSQFVCVLSERSPKPIKSATRSAIDGAFKSPSTEVRSAARKLWADRFPTQVVEVLGDTMNTGTVRERQEAMDLLAGLRSPAASKIIGEWMGRVEAGSCPPELQIEVLAAAAKSSDATLASAPEKVCR